MMDMDKPLSPKEPKNILLRPSGFVLHDTLALLLGLMRTNP